MAHFGPSRPGGTEATKPTSLTLRPKNRKKNDKPILKSWVAEGWINGRSQIHKTPPLVRVSKSLKLVKNVEEMGLILY